MAIFSEDPSPLKLAVSNFNITHLEPRSEYANLSYWWTDIIHSLAANHWFILFNRKGEDSTRVELNSFEELPASSNIRVTEVTSQLWYHVFRIWKVTGREHFKFAQSHREKRPVNKSTDSGHQ